MVFIRCLILFLYFEQQKKMGIEIERKFLLKSDKWKAQADGGTAVRQGYLNPDPNCTVRVRIMGENGFLTIKGKTSGISRPEFEYSIPMADALQLLDLCRKPILEKTRYLLPQEEVTWEIDVFAGENEGLVLAEVELESENQELELPEWLGTEVSGDARYYNANLQRNPFKSWS